MDNSDTSVERVHRKVLKFQSDIFKRTFSHHVSSMFLVHHVMLYTRAARVVMSGNSVWIIDYLPRHKFHELFLSSIVFLKERRRNSNASVSVHLDSVSNKRCLFKLLIALYVNIQTSEEMVLQRQRQSINLHGLPVALKHLYWCM